MFKNQNDGATLIIAIMKVMAIISGVRSVREGEGREGEGGRDRGCARKEGREGETERKIKETSP